MVSDSPDGRVSQTLKHAVGMAAETAAETFADNPATGT
jgi:hypothetical protein